MNDYILTNPTTDLNQICQYFANVKSGDIMYDFRTDDESWANLCGRCGICLVRDNVIIEQEIMMMN